MIQKKLSLLLLLFFSLLLFSQIGFSFSMVRIIPENKSTAETKNVDYLKGSVFINLSVKQFAAASGQKLNFFQRIYFKVIQKKVKRDLKANPDLLITNYYDQKKAKFKFNALWFVIASIIGPFGVLLAYMSHQKKETTTKKDRTLSAWLGFAFFVLWFGFAFVF